MAEEAKEQDLTPEEKLLKVIQEGDSEDPKAEEGASVEAAPSSTVTMQAEQVPAEEGAEKPKLKLAKAEGAEAASGDKAAAPKGEAEEKEEEKAAAAGMIAAGPMAVSKGGRGTRFGIGMVNKCLVAVVLIMIGFAVYEIWASIQVPEDEGVFLNGMPDMGWLDQLPEEALSPIEDVLKAFEQNPIIGPRKTVVIERTKIATPTPLVEYIKKNLNLIGLSNVAGDADMPEAIIMDKKIEKMHFLRLGDKIIINDRELELVAIAAEYAEVLNGETRIQIR